MNGYRTRRALTLKPTLRQTVGANRAAMDGLARLAGLPTAPLSQTEQHLAEHTRGPVVNRSDESELESAVLREVGELLAKHPAILFAVRQNGGMVQTAAGAPVWFYRWVRSPQPMVLTDFWGMDKRGRFWSLECKRRSWSWSKSNPTAREQEQRAFITTVRLNGGWGGFVTCAEDARRLIDGESK